MDKSIVVLEMINADVIGFNNEKLKVSETLERYRTEFKGYMNDLLSQISTGVSAPLYAKTPKAVKKKGKRIKAIPENDDIENNSNLSNTRMTRSSRIGAVFQIVDIHQGRSKRGASTKTFNIIETQLSDDKTDLPLENKIKGNSSKRPKELFESSEEEEKRPSKLSKIVEKQTLSKNRSKDETHDIINDSIQDAYGNETISSEKQKKTSVKRKLEQNDEDANTTSEQSARQTSSPTDEPVAKKANYSKTILQKNEKYANALEKISEQLVSSEQSEVLSKKTIRSSVSVINAQGSNKYIKANIVNETIDMTNVDETIASMYEDAMGKPVPIMNSTMNPNATVTLKKMMSATVVIEPLSIKNKFNETVTITKKKSSFKDPLSSSILKESDECNTNATRTIVHKTPENTNNISVNYEKVNTKCKKVDSNLDKFSELITDDESSPESKGYRLQKQKLLNQQKRVTRSNISTMSEEELFQTPIKTLQKDKDLKADNLINSYKPSALFSPYTKDLVKKRVEAFAQVASPKTNENETGGRVTRTKTRVLATASFIETPPQTVAQKLARKSLAKAKKISLAKQLKEHDETKEYDNTIKVKYTKAASSLEKSAQKSQLKTTPLGKRTLQMPGSISNYQYATPSNTQNLNAYSKSTSASRGNIVTNTDSFIQPMKSAQKTIDRAAEEKRRRAHEDDARRKREELLKGQAEEKRRKREEKELKNKLARETKEKLEQEKRLKAEREREEKAKLAQQIQEKQKEEMEKKRIAQLQKVQEKEERRKQEEQWRLHRLQEQEEQERLLAEQKRREQEQEKRKLLVEAKLKNQALMQAKAKVWAQKLAPINYKIDSDPDEDESDDERKPKHPIPSWASRHGRQAQLEMQQYIPMKIVTKFFDTKKCTPDLRELFTGIDPKKLKRSSSAIWRTPPRFSMMNSVLENSDKLDLDK